MIYRVAKDGAQGSKLLYVQELKSEMSPTEDVLLLYFYPSGEVDTPWDQASMLGALYDLYQCHPGLAEGDRFETPEGNFKCVGYHVVAD